MADFQVNAVLVCDDARREVSNKDILIGVYSSDLQVSTMPANILLSFWIEMTSKRKGPYEMTLRIQAPNPDHKFEIKVNGEVLELKSSFSIFSPQISYLIDREGQLKVYAKLPGSERFELIKSKQVKYVPALATRVIFNPSPTA